MDEQQLAYCDLVLRFRKVLNLTSVKEKQVFYSRFIIPSIALADWIPENSIVLDIGSGMGVPGIPLLIHRPDIKGILVERRKKRAEFLRHVVRTMKLNADVYDADINDLASLQASVCTARAVSEVQLLIAMCDQHIVIGGRAVLPVPDHYELPVLDGWCCLEDTGTQRSQRVACYEKTVMGVGGVSRET